MDNSQLQAHELAPYRNLYGAKESDHPEKGPCFICEGRFLVESALEMAAKGGLDILSLLGSAQILSELAPKAPPGVPLLTLPKEELQQLVGYPFHRGVLCAVRRPLDIPLERLYAARRLVVLPHVDNVDNLGLILRTAASLGMDGVLAGAGPGIWDRRTIRVSMGAAWKIPVWQREDLTELMENWKKTDGEMVGAALAEGAFDAQIWQPRERTALLLGSEAYGLDADWLARCDRHVMIRMANGMDSLNVAAAGAILMFQMQIAEGINRAT